jgi:hypothetical protein
MQGSRPRGKGPADDLSQAEVTGPFRNGFRPIGAVACGRCLFDPAGGTDLSNIKEIQVKGRKKRR